MISRRGLLLGMLAAGAAPAIVRSTSIMKIWTPAQEIIPVDEDLVIRHGVGDYTVLVDEVLRRNRHKLVASMQRNNTLLRFYSQ